MTLCFWCRSTNLKISFPKTVWREWNNIRQGIVSSADISNPAAFSRNFANCNVVVRNLSHVGFRNFTSTSVQPPASSSISTPPKEGKKTSVLSSFPNMPPWLEEVLEVWKKQSGTEEVLKLKQDVTKKSQAFDLATSQVTVARRTLDESMLLWERTNASHQQLLQKRDSWTPTDAQEFAGLIGQEVERRTAMEQARKDLRQSEHDLSEAQLAYMNAMRKRYHEEQIWQDQWRVLSTYGTWSLIVLNSCIFLGSQFFHYRREARKMKHLENLVQQNVDSQEAFKDTMVAERQAFHEAQADEKSYLASFFGSKPMDAASSAEEELKDELETDTSMESSSVVQTDSNGETSKNIASSSSETKESEEKNVNVDNPTIEKRLSRQIELPKWLNWLQNNTWIQKGLQSDTVQLARERTSKGIKVAQQSWNNATEDVHAPSVALGASITIALTFLLSTRNIS